MNFPLLITGVAGVIGFNALDYFQTRYPGQVIGVRRGEEEKGKRKKEKYSQSGIRRSTGVPPANPKDNISTTILLSQQTNKINKAGETPVLRRNGSTHFSSFLSPLSSSPQLIFADVDDEQQLQSLFEKYQFKSVIHSGGSCALKACQLNPELAWTLNLSTIRSMLAQCERYKARLICMSVDLVFKGRPFGEFYTESDTPDAVSIYGQTMSAMENLILLHRPQTCVLRISLPMGKSGTGHAGAIDWIASRFKPNRHATLFIDEYRTPTYCQDINRVLEEILNRDESEFSGLFHCGQPRPVSLYQCGQVINRVGDFDPNLLYGLKTNEGAPIPPRATNVAMNSQKLIDRLGFNPFTPWPANEQFIPTDLRWHFDRPENERRGWDIVEQQLERY